MSKKHLTYPLSNPDPDNGDPHQAIVTAFSAVFGKLMGYTTADWIKVDLSTAQIKVLFTLHFTGPYTINGLAERLNVGAPTASHLVEKLVQAGLAARIDSTTDRRIVEVNLTEQGHEMVHRLFGARNRIITQWITQLSDEQRNTLGQNLQALLTIIDNNAQAYENNPTEEYK